jgi:4-hydroxy-tetrahydrodipicolinate synthase
MTELRSAYSRTSDLQLSLHGLWLPLVTPFRNGELDEASLRRLVRHYADLPVDGLILAATTGESLTLAREETERLVFAVRDEIGGAGQPSICLGLSGSNTRALLDTLDRTAAWPIDGYLISCPYYSRPSQQGLWLHFSALADRAAHPVMLYNIPYRTGVNLGNEAMLRLADHRNIAGLKDCSGDRNQSLDLLHRRPENFAVLTGEDAQYHEALVDGADGGILVLAVGCGAHPAVVRRTEPGTDQVLAVAYRIDRQRGAAAADDGSERRVRRSPRSGNRTAKGDADRRRCPRSADLIKPSG